MRLFSHYGNAAGGIEHAAGLLTPLGTNPRGGDLRLGSRGRAGCEGGGKVSTLGVRGIRRERSVLNRNGVYLRPAWYFRRVPPFVVLYIRDIGQLNLLTGA